MILLAQDGEIREVAVNDHNVRRASEVIQADPSGFAQHGFETPQPEQRAGRTGSDSLGHRSVGLTANSTHVSMVAYQFISGIQQ